MRDLTITSVDLGNYNIKYVGKDGNGMFSSKISIAYQAFPDAFERISFNDDSITNTYYIGVGALQREFNKVKKEFLPQILYAICKANSKKVIETKLITLLPIVQMANKNKIINAFKNKDLYFKYNGERRIVSIDSILVLPEGYMSYYALNDEDKQGNICIIDIGSRTLNLCVIQDGKTQVLNTIKLGTFDFYTQVKDKENSKGNDFQEEDIQRLIDNKIIEITPGQYDNFLKQILNAIKPIVNIKTYNVIFTGGGSLLLKDSIQRLNLPKYKIMDDPLNSNVVGAKKAAIMIWGVSNGQ